MAVTGRRPPTKDLQPLKLGDANTTYENAVNAGYVGTEQEFYAYLVDVSNSATLTSFKRAQMAGYTGTEGQFYTGLSAGVNVFPVQNLPPLP